MATPYDFYSPFFRAAIIANPDNRDGTRYPLWSLTDSSGTLLDTIDKSNLGDLKSLAFCTEITVKFGLAYVPTLTATLSPPFQDARKFLESPLVEWTRSELEVQFGYTNGPQTVLSPVFTGRIMKPDVQIGIDTNITINAQGMGGDLATRGEADKHYEKQSRLEIMQDLLAPSRIAVNDDNVTGDARQLLDEQLDTFFPQNMPAYFNATELARVCGCWATLTTDPQSPGDAVFLLTPINDAHASTPKFKFRMFDYPDGRIGPASGVYPVLGFSSPTTSVFLAGATRAQRLHEYDSKTRKIKTSDTIDDTTATVNRSGQGQVAATKDGAPGDFYPGNVADKEELAKAQAQFKDDQSNMGVRIEVDSLGIPDLIPGQLIELAGIAAKRIDGNYAVFEVTHSLGTSGFATKFTGISNVGQFILLPGSDPDAEFSDAKSQNKNQKDEKAPQALSPGDYTVTAKVVA